MASISPRCSPLTLRVWILFSLVTIALYGCSADDSGGAADPGGGGDVGKGNDAGDGGHGSSGNDGGIGASGGDAGADAAHVPTPCEQIAPDGANDPAKNLTTIVDCLRTEGKAWLTAGTYPIASGIHVPAGAELKGLATPSPVLVLQKETGGNVTNYMVTLDAATSATPAGAKTHVAGLGLDAHNNIGSVANAATVMVGGDDALVESTDIYNDVQGPEAYTAAGVYFICQSCKGNVFKNTKIYNHYYGVIFRDTLTAATPNQVMGGEIHDIRCDSVTFAGYGEAMGITVHDTGWACNNGPIPGGGFYALTNTNGAKMIGNIIHDTCGHGLDLDRSSHFIIDNNHVYDPGSRFGGKYNYCAGNAAFLLDVSESTITGNTFENNGRTYNSGFDPNNVMHASTAGVFGDLPAGAKTVVAFVLAHRPNGGTDIADHNTLTGNVLRSFQDPASGYVGLGYFTSRGSGYAANGDWSASTTNYFTSNTSAGSNVGSVRCGGDWFAGSSTCIAGSPAPCNDDDYQHTGAFHSDACSTY
ncbi:MAG: right-handed parallel beta-helix repeat-containing protein [Polyangiaceae bacterium]